MVTITFNKENEAGRTLLAVARALMQSVQDSLITVHETQDEELADISTERISGLPYTMNERLEALRVAEEDIKAGRVYSHEDVMNKMRKRIRNANQVE